MDAQKVVAGLAPLERKVLPAIGQKTDAADIVKHTGLTETEVIRALQWLANKKLVELNRETRHLILLDINGQAYLKTGLPERRFLTALSQGAVTRAHILKGGPLSDEEFAVSLGVLKRQNWITISKDDQIKAELTSQGKLALKETWETEAFLARLPLDKDALTQKDQTTLTMLQSRRQLVKLDVRTTYQASLCKDGQTVARHPSLSLNTLEELTPALLKAGSWRTTPFRRYDIQAPMPKASGGSRHAYGLFLSQTKRLLAEMGFVEMSGPIIELEFFNFDALFQPQNHPARNWSDTYRIKAPKYGDLPSAKLVKAVKDAHEHGGTSGSRGWQYTWDPTVAATLMPIAHDTAVSPRYLFDGVTSPGKYFSVMRCFRPDVIDATHGVEFSQMGGFVIGSSLNFRHLLGLLRTVAHRLSGATEFRFIPCYYPFTEPSVQLSAKLPQGWMELCGAGMFRPEMLEALGVKDPVIAWGFGIDRLAMLKLGLQDIRNLFTADIEQLRTARKVRLYHADH